jgi:hypothetical protein
VSKNIINYVELVSSKPKLNTLKDMFRRKLLRGRKQGRGAFHCDNPCFTSLISFVVRISSIYIKHERGAVEGSDVQISLKKMCHSPYGY